MRPSFWPWTILFIVTRAGDLWSTSLWMLEPGGVDDELNPLTSVIGLGFWPVALVNVALTAAIVLGHWRYTKEAPVRDLSSTPDNWRTFLSLRYTGRIDQYGRLIWGRSPHGRLSWSFMAHGLIKALSVTGVLVVLHNLGQYHAWSINDQLRELLVRPAFVIYGLTGIAIVLFHIEVGRRAFLRWAGRTV